MAEKVGRKCKVTLGSNTVVGLGKWAMPGVKSDMLDITAFGDDWKKTLLGLRDGGSISFDGIWRPDDVTGAEALRYAAANQDNITNLRLYIDNTSYFTPCQTTGYWSPTTTTGAPTQLSYCNVTAADINADKADVVKVTFSAQVSGAMVLV